MVTVCTSNPPSQVNEDTNTSHEGILYDFFIIYIPGYMNIYEIIAYLFLIAQSKY